MEDYEGTLDYYQQALRGQDKFLGKSHPETLMTMMNMAIMFMDRTKDFAKAGEMYRFALDGYEKALGKDHEETQHCMFIFAHLLRDQGRQADLQKVLTEYPLIKAD